MVLPCPRDMQFLRAVPGMTETRAYEFAMANAVLKQIEARQQKETPHEKRQSPKE